MRTMLRLVASVLFCCIILPAALAQDVFINEIHYDNSGADTGEGVEIAGPAGTDLSGWSLVLYNGSNGTAYNNIALSGIITDQQGGLGTVSFAIAGIQNGGPDGLALVDASNAVVQFLSYEGSFTAVGGAADGLVSEDIGVAEASSTAVGFSLQLGGTGSVYTDFAWEAPQTATFDAANANQTLVGNVAPVVFINEIHYDNTGADTGEAIELAATAGVDLAGWSLVLYNGSNGAEYNTVALSGVVADQQGGFGTVSFPIAGIQNGGPDGVALVNPADTVVQFLSYEGSFTAVGGAADGLLSEDIGVSEASSTAVGFSLQLGGTGSEYADFTWEAAQAATFGAVNANQTFGGGGGIDPVDPPVDGTVVFVNELHYDNAGGDVDEGVEIAGPAGTDLTGWSLVLYNGNGGGEYNSFNLAGSLVDNGTGFGTLFTATAGLQNGSPDGVALINASNEVVQFLSYEGSFTATDGPAAGVESEDIGVAEVSSTPVGFSLQLGGTGSVYEDFVWEAAAANTYDAVNTNQTFVGGVEVVFVNELHYDNSGADSGEGVELAGNVGTDLAGWSIVLYNGNNNLQYNVVSLSGVFTDQDNGFGTIFFPVAGIQNGSPDGLALVNDSSEVVQFLSYEGTMTAGDGPANGLTSEDIGVSETSGAAVGTSMQLTGTGRAYADFTWETGLTATYDAVNTGQSFGGGGGVDPIDPEEGTIAAVRVAPVGTQIVTSGVLTASDQFGGPAFIQDATGGIALFDSQVHGDGLFTIGDSLAIEGSVGAFNDQVQIVDVTSVTLLDTGKNIVPAIISLTDLLADEGELVTIENVIITDPSGVFFPNRNYTIEDGAGNTGTLRIDADIDLVGRLIPEGSFTVTGVIGSFRGTPQLLPRFIADLPDAGEFQEGAEVSSDSTLDVVTWNMEFFGTTIQNFGPSDVTLQLNNSIAVVDALGSNILALQEVSDQVALQTLADSLGYESVCSARGSFSFAPDPNFPNQSLCYLYDPATVTVISTRAMFEEAYDSARLGLSSFLSDYPDEDGAEGFWASGRLPYLLEADVTINGVTERINFINIHGNSGASDLNKRIIDFGVLKDTLDAQFADKAVILLGDYNDDVDESIAGAGIASPYASLITDSTNYRVTTESLSLRGFNSFLFGSEMIDHIAITDELFEEFIEGTEATYLPFSLIDNYANTTSDHLPVVSRFEFTAIPVMALSGTALCSDDPANMRNWEVTNPNDFDVFVTIAYGAIADSLTVAPGTSTFSTGAATGDLTMSWTNELSETVSITIAASDFPCVDPGTVYSIAEVTDFNQGRRRNGRRISRFRSNASKALAPFENRFFNFVSLGFGGDITLKINEPLIDQEGNDFIVVETTFGWKGLPCSWYPETAEVFASKFGNEFTSLGQICLDGAVDLSAGKLDWAQFIKIVDVSDKRRFGPWADGYDVDGIYFNNGSTAGRQVAEAFNNEAPDEDIPFMVEAYPNPVTDALKLQISQMDDAPVAVTIMDQAGKLVYQQEVVVAAGTTAIDIEVSDLQSGLYHVIARNADEVVTIKIVKQ